jgi:hypothetical protein
MTMTITIHNDIMGDMIGEPIYINVSAGVNQPLHIYQILNCANEPGGYYLHVVAEAKNANAIWFVLNEWVELKD